MNGPFVLASLRNGVTNSANLGRKVMFHPQEQIKESNDFWSFGLGELTKAAILSLSGLIPFREKVIPKNLMVVRPTFVFEGSQVKPALTNADRTLLSSLSRPFLVLLPAKISSRFAIVLVQLWMVARTARLNSSPLDITPMGSLVYR